MAKKTNKISVNKTTEGEMGYKLPIDPQNSNDMSFVPPQEDGALDTYRMGGYYGTYLDLDGASKSEQELIKDIVTLVSWQTVIWPSKTS